MSKNITQHEGVYLHIEKRYLLFLVGIIILFSVGLVIWNANAETMKEETIKSLLQTDFGIFKILGLGFVFLGAEILIALFTNRIKQIPKLLLFGLLAGLLTCSFTDLLRGLFVGLAFSLLPGLLIMFCGAEDNIVP